MMAKLDKKLNIIIPVEDENGDKMHFHSMPILKETFERYSFVIAKTFSKLALNDLMVVGPRIAALTVKEVAEELGKWESNAETGYVGIKDGLMEEIKRLTSVIVWDDVWTAHPVDVALKKGLIDEESWDEANQHILFFTLVYSMTTGAARRAYVEAATLSWGTQITSLNPTEYADSLPILTETETSFPAGNQSSALY